MPNLADLQKCVRDSITQRRPPALEMLVPGPRRSAQDRLQIYTDAYRLRLIDSLGSDFPATRRVLGAERFARIAIDYLQKYPSSSTNISDAGWAFPHFAASHSLLQTYPYLADLLRLEWAVLEVLYTDRLPPLDTSSLADIPESAWATARLVLDPTVRLLQTAWPVDRLWDKRRGPEPKQPSTLRQKQRYLLLYRDAEWVQMKVLDEPRWQMLQLLQDGASLGSACEQVGQRFAGQTLPAMKWFGQWIGAGVIKQVVFEKATGFENR